ncbi:MAG: tripartite tricarboxylate transporter substrate binding protein [Burkholderiaceae bacterium]|jgi:tripartite-type tricarboxylate transporter receptor subunit TctC|nr:tripartite tricarboxylate transporter substrate binding protein [Burkholderiaceae bacterium]
MSKLIPRGRRDLLLCALSALVPARVWSAPVQADEFPSHRLRFVVPYPPGSAADTEARHFGRKLKEITGQPVLIESRPGNDGIVAVRAVLEAPADGYTVLIGSSSTLALNAAVFKQLPYDPVKDLKPLTMMMRSPVLLVVPGDSRYKTLAELVADAKGHPYALDYSAGSEGYQFMAELFNEMAGVKTHHIPFNNISEATAAVATGTVAMAFREVASVQELIQSGKVRGLAVAAEKRVPSLPEVPTAAEAGLPGFTAYSWVAAMVSANTPKRITDKLAALMARIENLPETRQFNDRMGIETIRGGPDELHDFQLHEIDLWKRVAKQAKIVRR